MDTEGMVLLERKSKLGFVGEDIYQSQFPVFRMGRWACGHVDRWTCGHVGRWAGGQMGIWAGGQVYRWEYGQVSRALGITSCRMIRL